MRTDLKGLEIRIEYREGEFETSKKLSLYFSSIKPEHTGDRIASAVEAIRKELFVAMKHDYRPTVDLLGIDWNYKFIDGFRYCVDTYDAKVDYRKWVPTANIYDVDRTEQYIGKNGLNKTKLAKSLTDQVARDAIDFVLNYGRVPYDV